MKKTLTSIAVKTVALICILFFANASFAKGGNSGAGHTGGKVTGELQEIKSVKNTIRPNTKGTSRQKATTTGAQDGNTQAD